MVAFCKVKKKVLTTQSRTTFVWLFIHSTSSWILPCTWVFIFKSDLYKIVLRAGSQWEGGNQVSHCRTRKDTLEYDCSYFPTATMAEHEKWEFHFGGLRKRGVFSCPPEESSPSRRGHTELTALLLCLAHLCPWDEKGPPSVPSIFSENKHSELKLQEICHLGKKQRNELLLMHG